MGEADVQSNSSDRCVVHDTCHPEKPSRQRGERSCLDESQLPTYGTEFGPKPLTAIQHLLAAELMLHGVAFDDEHGDWAHGLIHQAASHLSEDSGIRAQVEAEARACAGYDFTRIYSATLRPLPKDRRLPTLGDEDPELVLTGLILTAASQLEAASKSGVGQDYLATTAAMLRWHYDRRSASRRVERHPVGLACTVPECTCSSEDSVSPVNAVVVGVEAGLRYVVRVRGEDLCVTHDEITPRVPLDVPVLS